MSLKIQFINTKKNKSKIKYQQIKVYIEKLRKKIKLNYLMIIAWFIPTANE